MKNSIKTSAFLFFACAGMALAAPMESREWEASSGHKTTARALSATASSVTLELASGKTIDLPLDKLVVADQEAIITHFKIEIPKEGDPIRSDAKPLSSEGLEHKLGEVSGNIESAPGSHYHLYLPNTLKEGRRASVIHFNNAGQLSPQQLKPYIAACERFGWIIAGSAESSNKTGGEGNYKHAENNVAALKESPLVDPKRVYFTGNSGGGAQSWWNCAGLNGAGTMPNIGYISSETQITKGHHFVLGGARDYNRYLSANAASRFGKDANYRAFPGGHSGVKEGWIYEEGIAWLTAKYLLENQKDSALAGDRLDFEAAIIDWMAEINESNPQLAYHIGKMMQDVYEVSGKNGDIIAKKVSELGSESGNVRFSEGLAAIHDFGVKSMSPEGTNGGSAFGKNPPALSRKALDLSAKFSGVPFVEETLKELSEPTVKK